MVILGLGGLMDDGAAACLVRDGKVLAAVEQVKLLRPHREGTLPEAAIASCLDISSVAPDAVDVVAVARPFASGTAFHLRVRAMFPNAQLMVVDHHMAHAASAFYPSGFSHATVLTFDRGGDFRCGAKWHASEGELRLEREFHFPDSVGDLYSRVTELLGYTPRADEHKVQWLSTAGSDQFVPLFGEIFDTERMRIHPAYTDTQRSRQGLWSAKLFEGLGLEDGDTPPDALKPDIAYAAQDTIERAVIEAAGAGDNLCLAGGLFFNALLVAALERSGKFKNVFVQPAAGNAGTALGAAFAAWKRPADLGNLCLGPEYSLEESKRALENCKLRFRYLLTTDEIISNAVELIGDNRIVAWMQGRMEFGARALGNRSILASPLNQYSTENLNVFIKHREPYRKFAASVPAEIAGEYFEAGDNARFLATVGKVREAHRRTFASAILGDNLVRVHTVTKEDNPLYHRLLLAAGEATGLPVLFNTSFNLFGDPLVCSPRDAVRSFYSSGIDALFVGNFLMQK
jgi:carbamoyltransferase